MTDQLDISRNVHLPMMVRLGEILEEAARSSGNANEIDETEKVKVISLWKKYKVGCELKIVTEDPSEYWSYQLESLGYDFGFQALHDGLVNWPRELQCNVNLIGDVESRRSSFFLHMAGDYLQRLQGMSAQEMTRAMLLLREHPPLDVNSYPRLSEEQTQRCVADDVVCLMLGGHHPELACIDEDPITGGCSKSALMYCAPWRPGFITGPEACRVYSFSE